ncbi:MAG: hypothetical protein J0L61_13125 [Planctomycetes bacterium]|nr:hypothetical protein [Planctomycetota bacterium]
MNRLKPLLLCIALLAALLSGRTARAEDALAQGEYASFITGTRLAPGAVTKFDFTVTTQDTVYFMFTSTQVADAYILTPNGFLAFQAGTAFSTPGGFRNQSGRQTITLAAGQYTVGIKNTGTNELSYAFRVSSTKQVQSVRASETTSVLPGGRFTKSFTVNPGDKMILQAAAQGLQGYILAPSEATKFKAGLAFIPVTGQPILESLQGGLAGGELTLNEGTFHIGFANPTASTRPATFVIAVKKPDFTGGGPVNPPSDVVPFFDSKTDEGVGGTFDGETFRTRFNNRNASTAPSFLVSGCTAGQFVRVYASGVLIAQGVAGGPQLTLKANGKARLNDGTFPITASQFNGQTESEKTEFFDMVIDTVAPSAPADLDLTDDSDTGPSADDNVTSATNLTFTGTSEPLARVVVTANGKLVNVSSVQADENGDWTITVPASRTGKIKYAAVQLDTAGNQSRPSEPLTVEVLKRPNPPARPALIKADAGKTVSGAVQTTNPNPTFTGSAGKGNTVTLILDGQDTQSVVADTKGKWSITLDQPIVLGEHTVAVKQIDLAGGVSNNSPTLRIRLIEPQ